MENSKDNEKLSSISGITTISKQLAKKKGRIYINEQYLLKECIYKGMYYNSYRGTLIIAAFNSSQIESPTTCIQLPFCSPCSQKQMMNDIAIQLYGSHLACILPILLFG